MMNEKNSVSYRGKLSRKSIAWLMHFPHMDVNNMLELGSKYAKRSDSWDVPQGYTLSKYNIDGLPLELLVNLNDDSENVILQFHGGAYIIGFMDLYRNIALKYSNLSKGASVVSIDYRLAPRYQYPAALDDAYKAWNWLLDKGYKENNIIIVGDSAGGNLALSLTLKLRDEGKYLPKALICMSPWADMSCSGKSYSYNLYNDPLFGLKKGETLTEKKSKSGMIGCYAGDTDSHNRYLSPVYGDFHNFPPILIQVGTYELIESDSVTIYEKAVSAGVDATLTRYEGMFHMFQLFGNLIPEGKAAWREVALFLRKQFNS